MKKTIILGIFALLLGLSACEKADQTTLNDKVIYETVKPLDYFPAFPGSYWVYDSNDTLKVADQYEKYIFNTAAYDAVPDYDTLMLPKLILNGVLNAPDTFAYVNEYSISKAKTSHYKDPAFKTLLSLTEGAEFAIGGAIQGHKITGKTIKVDTTITVGNTVYEDVIVTIQFDDACVNGTGGTPEDCATMKIYFAKDIGLIKREKRNESLDFVTDIELVEYKINK